MHEVAFRCIYFLVSFSNVLKISFFRSLAYDGLYKFNKEGLHSNFLRFSLILSLDVKLEIKNIQSSRQKKFHKQPVVVLLKNFCSIRHMFCTIFIPLSVAKSFEKHVRSGSFIAKGLFQGKFTFTWKINQTAISITVTLHLILRTNNFRTPISGC